MKLNGYDWLESNPGIFGGKPVVRGTRISVHFIMELVASGGSAEAIHAAYPHVPIEGIREAIRYAAASLSNEKWIEIELEHEFA